ncbi:MAG: phasin family protein [Alphaproteobacteria bacterium]|nr:phasin family protein [Alphaproteobacteria bacterium]
MTEHKNTPDSPLENPMMESMVDMRHFVDANGTAMDAMIRSGEATLKGMATINEEMMNFADKRARASIDTCQSLVRCVTFAEAMELQSQYARSVSEAYMTQASRILNLSAEIAKNGMVSMQTVGEDSPGQAKK